MAFCILESPLSLSLERITLSPLWSSFQQFAFTRQLMKSSLTYVIGYRLIHGVFCYFQLAQPIRLLLNYVGEEFEDVMYVQGSGKCSSVTAALYSRHE